MEESPYWPLATWLMNNPLVPLFAQHKCPCLNTGNIFHTHTHTLPPPSHSVQIILMKNNLVLREMQLCLQIHPRQNCISPTRKQPAPQHLQFESNKMIISVPRRNTLPANFPERQHSRRCSGLRPTIFGLVQDLNYFLAVSSALLVQLAARSTVLWSSCLLEAPGSWLELQHLVAIRRVLTEIAAR